jgi:hypothetical protein
LFLFLLLGSHRFWQAVEVYLIGRERFQAGALASRLFTLSESTDLKFW